MRRPAWTTACPDWEERILGRRSLIPFAPLFPEESRAALEVFCGLRVVDLPGRPRIGEIALPWMTDFAAAFFGAYDPETGERLVNDWHIDIAKKNAKSTVAAALLLTCLVRNWRESGEFYILAPTKEIADNSFLPARDMVRADPVLRDLLHVQEIQRTITHRNTKAFAKVIAADAESVGGKKTIGLIIDELWLFGSRPHAGPMLREAKGGLASRPEGFVLSLSTKPDAAPAGVYAERLDYFRKVRDGKIEDRRSCGLLYEFPERLVKAQAHLDAKNFYIPNPNLGASVNEQFLVEEYAKAQIKGKADLANFFAKHLNVEPSGALLNTSWPGAEFWEAAAIAPFTLAELLERCEVAVVGLDGGGLDDLLGLCVIGREKGGEDPLNSRWIAWGKAWAHSRVLKLRQSEAARLMDLAESGELVIYEEVGEDVAGVVEIVRQVYDSGVLAQIGADPAGITDLVDAINIAIYGVAEPPESEDPLIVGVSQGWTLQLAIKGAERRLAKKSLAHAGQALMAWCVGNAKQEIRGSATYITKAASGTGKIDPLMALFNAVFVMSRNPKPRHARSLYDNHDIFVLRLGAA